MSVYPAVHGAIYPRETQPPRWFIRALTQTIDEGDEARIEINCTNPTAGAKLRLWWYNLVAPVNWSHDWHVALEAAAQAVGCSYQRDIGSSILGTQSGSIILSARYAGEKMLATNRARRNRKNDVQPNPDGSPGSRFVSMAVDAATTTGTFRFLAGFQIAIRDTSRTPADQPTIRLVALDDDGVSPAQAAYYEGESFRLVFRTENIVPGTEVKCYIANVGQTRFSPPFRTAMIEALRAAPGVSLSYSTYPPRVPEEVFYQGATIIYEDDYLDAVPVSVRVTTKMDDLEQGSQQADFILQVTKEGDLSDIEPITTYGLWSSSKVYHYGDTVVWLDDGGNYVYIAPGASSGHPPSDGSRWRAWRKTIVYSSAISREVRDVPPRYWELAARTDGSTITYRIHVPSGTAGASSVILTSGGTKPPGFDDALAAALLAHPETVTLEEGRLRAQATSLATAELVFTVPHPAGTPGKHTLRLSDLDGGGWIVIEDAVVFLTAPTVPYSPSFITGTNLDGGEFGRKENTGFDNYGFNYFYPHRPERAIVEQHVVMNYHWSKGARLFRFPILWGRIQDELFGPLTRNSPPVSRTDRADMWRIDECIGYWTNVLGGFVLLDLHNFGNGPNGGKVRYDWGAVENGIPIAALADVWVRLAQRYAGNPRVWLGLMNEPNGSVHSPTRNRDNMQAVTNAIRARTDSVAKILVAAGDYSSATNFVVNGNAAALESFYDPAGNHAFEVHCYFDADASGTKPACVSGSRTRIVAATNWALANGKQLLLGEFGAGDPAVSGQEICGVEMPGALAYIAANKPAWLGWTAYFGGDRWGAAFPFTIDPQYPSDFTLPTYDNGQMQMLIPYFETVE